MSPAAGEAVGGAFPDLGEFLRRAALGSLALLVVARAYYPSEDAETGSGLVWILLLIGVAGIAVASALLGGVTRFRWSGADLFVYALILLVAGSAGHAADRRAAITMAWEWGGIGIAYALARNLPRSRGESSALAAILVATAVAVASYGLFQTEAEFPRLRAMFSQNPEAMMAPLGIVPGTPAAVSFAHRLMDSNEPFSTFALANSLAGFIVGPLVLILALGLENLRRDPLAAGRGSKGMAFAAAAVPATLLLVCLLLTKSRSAAAGLLGALVLLGWSYRGAIPRRWLLGAATALGVAVLGLIGAGLATRQLDVQIITEARKSLGYRWEYWVGTWGVITDARPPFTPAPGPQGAFGGGTDAPTPPSTAAFWWGVGPANFAGPYLRHKLPEASEEIQDPHNLILEVWAESGFFAALALVAALGWGIARTCGTAKGDLSRKHDKPDGELRTRPDGHGWLFTLGGLGWFGVWALGRLDPVRQADMTARWLILGAAWPLAIFLLMPLWGRRPIPAISLGAAVVAVSINLLAAGGIGIPSVSMMLWLSLALGLNLRDGQSSGRLRELPGLGWGIALACGWAVVAGTFYGAVIPGWRSDQAIAEGEAAMMDRPPRFDEAREKFTRAIEADRYSTLPWTALAELEFRSWLALDAQRKTPSNGLEKNGDRRNTSYTRVLLTFDKALEGEFRDPNNLGLRRRQANYARTILSRLPEDAKPFEYLGLRSTIAKATRQAVRLYPTSAALHAELAQASEDLGMHADAVAEARAALQLDAMTPHLDKKLPGNLRSYLTARIPEWSEQAKAPPPAAPGR